MLSRGALRITRTIDPPGLAISGDVDEFTYSGLLSALADIVGEAAEIHVNMARVQYCDLAGLRAIIGLTGTSGDGQAQRARRVVLHGISPQLRAVLRIVGWDAMPGLALQVRVPAVRWPEPPTAALLPAGEGSVHFPYQNLGWLGGGDLLPTGRGESHRVAAGPGPASASVTVPRGTNRCRKGASGSSIMSPGCRRAACSAAYLFLIWMADAPGACPCQTRSGPGRHAAGRPRFPAVRNRV